jgi:hypothetical protein
LPDLRPHTILRNNVIPGGLGGDRQGNAAAQYFPEPTPAVFCAESGTATQNYHLLTTAQSNSTQAGVRYMRSLGKNATLPGGGAAAAAAAGATQQNQGLRQSINFNYNWSHSASDNVNIFPQLGGKSSSNSNSLQAGYTVGYHKITNIFNANWNRSHSQTTNFFTNGPTLPPKLGIWGKDGAGAPLNYGLPNVVLSSIHRAQRAAAELLALADHLALRDAELDSRQAQPALWRRLPPRASRLSGRLELDRNFTLPASPRTRTTHHRLVAGGFSAGLPQETTIDASAGKSYLRDNVMDAYAQDDWRVRTNLTLNYGLRYEFFAPYTEKYGHLAMVDTNPARAFTGSLPTEVQAGRRREASSSGKLPDFAGLSLPHSLCAALGHGAAAAQTDRGAGRLRHELHRRPVRDLCHDHGAAADGQSAVVCERADQRGGRRESLRWPMGFPAPDTNRATTRSTRTTAALRAGVEPRRAEDAALGRGDECRLQRLEGQSPGHHQRAARNRAARQHRSHKS